jgi:hypothetical protein
MKNYFILVIIVFMLPVLCSSQSRINDGVGAYGSFNYNMHETDFSQLPNVPNCCPQFSSGNGSGFSVGVFYELPFLDNFSGQLRAGFSMLSGELSEIENELIIYNDQLETAEIEHLLTADFSLITFGLYGRFLVFDGLSIIGGFNAGLPIAKKYSQKESLVKPVNYGVFENGTRTRNVSEGDIEGVSPVFLLLDIGLSYDIPLNKRNSMFLSPEIFYSVMINDVLENDKWRINSLKIGLSLRYSLSYEFASPLKPESD